MSGYPHTCTSLDLAAALRPAFMFLLVFMPGYSDVVHCHLVRPAVGLPATTMRCPSRAAPRRVLYCCLSLSCLLIASSTTYGLGGHLRYGSMSADSMMWQFFQPFAGGGGGGGLCCVVGECIVLPVCVLEDCVQGFGVFIGFALADIALRTCSSHVWEVVGWQSAYTRHCWHVRLLHQLCCCAHSNALGRCRCAVLCCGMQAALLS